MNLELLRQNISFQTETERLREIAYLLVKCIASDSTGGGYCVVNDHNPPYSMYSGSREHCIAFIEGYDAAPLTDVGCFDHSVLCVCVDAPSRPIVIPEERFGEFLAARKNEVQR